MRAYLELGQPRIRPRNSHHEFRPEHLESTAEDIRGLRGGGQEFIRKISQIFQERRLFVAHVFFNTQRWHAFYFDQRDRSTGNDNHWKDGAHVHFVNDLWPDYTLTTFWDSVNVENPRFRGALHIRYRPDETLTPQHEGEAGRVRVGLH